MIGVEKTRNQASYEEQRLNLTEGAGDALMFYKNLAEENRLLSLLLLKQEGELCVCEIMEALNQSQHKISRHLAQLRRSGLLVDRRQGQWVLYRLNPDMHNWMQDVLERTLIENPHLLEEPSRRLSDMSTRPIFCSTSA